MTALVLAPRPALPQSLQWSWPRVSAVSGTLSLHIAAIVLLLAPPVAMKLLPPPPVITEARIIEPPEQLPEPSLPIPPKIVHEVQRRPDPKPVPQAPPPPVAESPMHSQAADPTPAPVEIAPPAPAEVAPVALAYNTRTKIPYPHDAFVLRQQGTVILRVLVGTDGVPQTVEVEKSSGSRSLDVAARDAVKKWTFQAGTRNGIPQPLWARVPISFNLQLL